MFKSDFVFEKYLDILPTHLAKHLFHFRCMNHKLPVEKGRFSNIPRELRICNLCNTNSLGDEFHSLFICKFFDSDRRKYIDKYFIKHPNSVKFSILMNSTNRTTLLKLAVFCKKIILSFK